MRSRGSVYVRAVLWYCMHRAQDRPVIPPPPRSTVLVDAVPRYRGIPLRGTYTRSLLPGRTACAALAACCWAGGGLWVGEAGEAWASPYLGLSRWAGGRQRLGAGGFHRQQSAPVGQAVAHGTATTHVPIHRARDYLYCAPRSPRGPALRTRKAPAGRAASVRLVALLLPRARSYLVVNGLGAHTEHRATRVMILGPEPAVPGRSKLATRVPWPVSCTRLAGLPVPVEAPIYQNQGNGNSPRRPSYGVRIRLGSALSWGPGN
jgi:hypothetical protein